MRVLYPGHTFVLRNLDPVSPETMDQTLQFVKRGPLHEPTPGTTNQEVCRALISRLQVLDDEKPYMFNHEMINKLRDVIMLHEVRAYDYKVQKAGTVLGAHRAKAQVLHWFLSLGIDVAVEDVPVGEDGHWVIPMPEPNSHIY